MFRALSARQAEDLARSVDVSGSESNPILVVHHHVAKRRVFYHRTGDAAAV
jgi:hypothetical protein